MSRKERAYRGISPTDRKADRRARLLDSGLDVIGDVGLSGLTMTLVVRRANLTERYFYENFADRSELVGAALASVIGDVDAAILVALGASSAGVEAKARATAQAIVTTMTGDRRKARLFVESASSPTLHAARNEAVQDFAQHLARKIRMVHGLESTRDRARLRVVTRMLVGGIVEAVGGWLDGSLRESPELLVEESTRLAVAVATSFERP